MATMATSSPAQHHQQQRVIESSPQMHSSMSADAYLKSCTASDLADRLLVDRFNGDKNKALDFVRQCQNAMEQSNSSHNGSSNKNDKDAVDFGDPLLSEPVVLSMISPRGKVSLEFFDRYIRATDVKTSTEAWVLASDQVMQVVVFPKPEDCKKDLSKKSSDVVLLHLTDPLSVRNQKKPVSQVSFVLPTDLPVWKEQPTADVQDPTVAWNQVLQRAVGKDTKVLCVKHPQAAAPSAFTSYQTDRVSTTSGGMPFVTCYHGTKDGVLFPLTDGGLLFYKPPFLIPKEHVEGITKGGRGGANSRYVDLVVQIADDETMEFTNVNRDEVEGLTKFLSLAGAEAVVESDEDNDSQDNDEETSRGGVRQRSKRKASVEARRINKRIVVAVPTAEDEDDDDDDIEYMAGAAVDNEDEDMDDEEEEDDDSDAGADEASVGNDDDDGEQMQDESNQNDETEDETESEG